MTHILCRPMSVCPRCGAPADEGALFCRKCGATIPPTASSTIAAPAGVAMPPPPLATPPPGPFPWTPPPLAYVPPPPLPRNAQHCPNCNNVISAASVVCPICGAPVPPGAADAGVGAPPV